MRIYDVTLTIRSGMPLYPGDPPFAAEDSCRIARGDACNVSRLSLGSHLGTHVDAPKHFLDDGLTLDRVPLEHFLGPAKVFALPGKKEIAPADLAGLPIGAGDRVLLKTDNSARLGEDLFRTDFTYLSPDAARHLAGKGILTLGFDYLSVERYGAHPAEAHLALLGAGVVIIEGLDLRGIEPGTYHLCALPLKIAGGNGSPVRAVLVEA